MTAQAITVPNQRINAPRQDVSRAVPFEVTSFTDIPTGYRFEGYAMMWDMPARINSWEGEFDETIKRSAPRKSIKERTPVMQFDHGRHPRFGSIPLGNFVDIREDAQGLRTIGELHRDEFWSPLHEALRSGSIKGMSFRFDVVKEKWGVNGEGIQTRDLVEIKIMEMGPVVFPAYNETTASIRSRESIYLLDLNDPSTLHSAPAPVESTRSDDDSDNHSDAPGSHAAPIDSDHSDDPAPVDTSDNLVATRAHDPIVVEPEADAEVPQEDDHSEERAAAAAVEERDLLAGVFDAVDKRFQPLI